MRKKIAFNIGASIGNSIDEMNEYDIIYAFEPNPFSFNKLIENKNNVSNIKFFQLAIAEKDGYLDFNCHHHYEYSSLLKMKIDGEFANLCSQIDPGFDIIEYTTSVKVKRLDTFLIENNIPYIDFLKIDTQGYDFNVIKSAGSFIKDINLIELEVQNKPLYANSFSKEEVILYLKNKNFELINETWNNEFVVGYEQRLTFKNTI